MAGDITRHTFRAEKHYSGVRMQQGRVQMDADWNEQLDIRAHIERTTNLDVIGPCGAPEPPTANFAVQVQGANLLIRQGRIYVDGILCENDQDVLLALPSPAGATPVQPDLPGVDISSGGTLSFEPLLTKLGVPAGFAPLPTSPGIYSAYLDVWERLVVALDDPSIREVALGGPDTATRTRVVWQVKLLPLGQTGGQPTCPTDWSALASTGLLAARAQPDPGNNNPCAVPAQAGYRRLENQLYRIEIHTGGDAKSATFKWSRDNASVIAGWTGQDAANPDDLFATTLGKDTELGFSGGQWVELTDDTRELWGIPGTLVQLKAAQVTGQGPTLTIDPATASPAGPVSLADFPLNPKIRRWDQAATPAITLVGGALAVQENAWLDLEDGVQVFFTTGGKYQTGDHWLIPARTTTAISTPAVEWPTDNSAAPAPLNLPAAGIRHHYCALALLQANPDGTWTFLKDCRPIFPPLTGLGTQAAGCCCTVTVGPKDVTGNQTLQSILESLAGTKATICLLPGVYDLPAPLVLTSKHSGFTIEGCHGGVTLQAAAGTEKAFLDGLMVVASADQVTLKGVTFRMPLVPFAAAGGKFAGLDPTALAGLGGPKVATLRNLFVSVGLRPIECTDLTVEGCDFLYGSIGGAADAAMVVTAAEAGAAGNHITVDIAVHPGREAAGSTFDMTVTETSSYTGLTMATVESVLGSDTVRGKSPGLVRVQHVDPAQAPPPSGTHQLAGAKPTSTASVKVTPPGKETGLTFVARKSGPDGALTSVQISSDQAKGHFDLQATWTKTVKGATAASAAKDLAALGYAVTVAPPAGGAFAVPPATQDSPIHLSGGADAPSPKPASTAIPRVRRDVFEVGILAGGACSGLKIEGNSFGPDPGASAAAAELFQEPFRLSLGCVVGGTAAIGSVATDKAGAATFVTLDGATWVVTWVDRLSLAGNIFNGLGAAALLYGEAGAIRIEDNDVRNGYSGFLIYARFTAPVINDTLAKAQPPIQDILQDAVMQVGLALVLSYPLPAAFTDKSAITQLPSVGAPLSPSVFPNLPLLNAFDVLLQMLNMLQLELMRVAQPQGLTLSLVCTGNVVEALMLDPGQDASGPGLIVWGDDQNPTGNVIVSANRIENSTPPFVPTAAILLVGFTTINGNLILNDANFSTSVALMQFTTVAAAGNVFVGNTNLPASWDAVNVNQTAPG
jgi:hypothetical protein